MRSYYERARQGGASSDELDQLAGRGVTFCGWTQIVDMPTELLRVRKVRKKGETVHRFWHAYLTGRQMCALRWACPICTARRAEEDRKFINDGVAMARTRGLWLVMLTLTTRHTKREAAADVLTGIQAAEQRLKRLKVWQRLSERCVGYVRVLEWTYGRNGHHPHYHTILALEAGSEAEAIAAVETLRPAYLRQLTRAGRDGTSDDAARHSFQVQGANRAESYLLKWGLAEELAGAQSKEGVGYTPWQLLRLSRTAGASRWATAEQERERFAAVWWEILQATKGRAQLYKSEGWQALAEAYREANPPEPTPEPETVISFGIRQRGSDGSARFLQARTRTLALREAAESVESLAEARFEVEVALRLGLTDHQLLEQLAEDAADLQVIDDEDDFEEHDTTEPLPQDPAEPPPAADEALPRLYRINPVRRASSHARKHAAALQALAELYEAEDAEGCG